jgi:hypothetical protein
MDGLSVAARVAGVVALGIQVTQYLIDFYEVCKAQKSYIANTAKELENLLGVLDSLHRQLKSRKFRPDEQDLLQNIEGLIQVCEESIHELQTKIEKFKNSPRDGLRATLRSTTDQLAYPFKESTLRKLDADIDEIVPHLSLALQLLQQKDIINVQDDIEDSKAVLSLVRAGQVSSEIRDWLKAPDASIDFNNACNMKHPGTGLWFVKGSSVSTWLVKPKSFLWLNGFAGCGKSVLCSTAIQHTHRHRRSNPRGGIAFFFFTFNDDSKQDASAMLRALILQLSSQLNDNYSLLSQLHDRHRNATPPNQYLEICLHELIKAFDHVYILLDGLDESPRNKHRSVVLEALAAMRKWSESGLHLLVTSRDEIDIHEALHDELHISLDEIIPMKNDSVDNDIASYVSDHLKESRSRKLQRWRGYYDQIEKKLTQKVGGCTLFLFLKEKSTDSV